MSTVHWLLYNDEGNDWICLASNTFLLLLLSLFWAQNRSAFHSLDIWRAYIQIEKKYSSFCSLFSWNKNPSSVQRTLTGYPVGADSDWKHKDAKLMFRPIPDIQGRKIINSPRWKFTRIPVEFRWISTGGIYDFPAQVFAIMRIFAEYPADPIWFCSQVLVSESFLTASSGHLVRMSNIMRKLGFWLKE